MENIDNNLLKIVDLDLLELSQIEGGSEPPHLGYKNSIIGVAARFIGGLLIGFADEITS